jgi:cellobiose-specific phosphotransferase system component IIB
MPDLLSTLITILISAVAGAVTPVLVARYSKTKQERAGETKILDAKTEGEIAKAAESIAAGSTVTIANLLRSVEYQKQEVAEARTENAALNEEIEKIKEARAKRDIESQKERDELKARIQSDLIETKRLRNDYAVAQKQIIKLEDMAIKLGEYVDTMKNAMQEAGIDLKLNGELLDSVIRLKAARRTRGE